jgi:hypothetical protein
MTRVVMLLCAALFWTSQAAAQGKDKDEPSKKQLAQQERMKSCNAQAAKKEMKGDERKAFMSKCLKADSGELTAQQERMVTCNEQAGRRDLKGDERKAFMSKCLRGDSAAGGAAASPRSSSA